MIRERIAGRYKFRTLGDADDIATADGRDVLTYEQALRKVTDPRAVARIGSANTAPQITPGLLAWLEHAADWELRRRAGVNFALQAPDAAIDPTEDAASLTAALMMRDLASAAVLHDARLPGGASCSGFLTRLSERDRHTWRAAPAKLGGVDVHRTRGVGR